MSDTDQVIRFDSQPPLPFVLQAIRSLYHDSNNSNKENADKWLKELQNSLYAWKIADELLIKKEDQESCYFAAQTLRTKIQLNFKELPSEEAYISLKNSIINHLKSFQVPTVQTQLALCITYLAILAPSWQNPVEELVSQELDRTLLIEILTYLLEELDQSRQKYLKGVGATRRQQFTDYLIKIAPSIINLLNNTLQETIVLHQTEQSLNPNGSSTGTEKLIAKIYRCLGAWINIIDPKEINLIEPLLAYVFESLKDPDLNDMIHDSAADTICGAALLCENYTKYQQLTHFLLNHIYQLEHIYHHSVSNEDIDKSVNYSRIFTEMAESIVSPLIVDVACEQNNYNIPALKIIDLLLHCIAHYDYEVAEITFHFWFRFTELIHKKSSTLLPLFSTISNKLILGLTRHCQLEVDQEGLLNNDSNLYEFRLRVRDLIKEVIFIVGAKNYINDNNIIGELENSLSQVSQSNSIINWEEVEAQLFILSCIVADINDDQLILNIINLVLQTRSSNLHTQIFATNCTILGELSQWLETNHQYINPILNYLLGIITSANQLPQPTTNNYTSITNNGQDCSSTAPITLASISANSLQKVVSSNSSKDLVGNLQLINILIEICSQLDLIANEEAAHNLLKCCSTIISTDDDHTNIQPQQQTEMRQNKEELIVRLLKPSVDSLNALACGQQTKSDPGIYLDRISAVFKNLRFKEPSNEISLISQLCTQQIWPLIENLLKQTVNLDKMASLVEKSCRCLRSIIRFLKPVWLLKPIANTIVSLYQHNPAYSTYLYLASILVDEFGATADPEISNGLISMLNAFCMSTFTLLQDSQLKNNPETIEDFFRLCTRFLQKNPEQFITNAMLEPTLNLTVASLSLEQRDANKSVTKFIDELFSSAKGRSSSVCEDVLRKMLAQQDFGQRLLQAALFAGLVNLPSYFIGEMGDVIWKISNWDHKLFEKWLQISLQSLPTQIDLGLNVIEPTQLEEFYNNLINATSPKSVVQAIRYLSRFVR